MDKRPLIVSGSHRSATTWVGRILSAPPGVKYIYEPFNIEIHRKTTVFKYWFHHLSERSPIEEQARALAYIKAFSSWRWEHIADEGVVRGAYRLAQHVKGRPYNRYLYKDPIAIMSLEWLAANLGADVVITVRHPAAFVASLKVKNWTFDFSHFLQQVELMSTLLSPFRKEIEEFCTKEKNVIEQGTLLWNIIYSTVKGYQARHPEWIVIRHEDLSAAPVTVFRDTFLKLGLDYSEAVERKIRKSSEAETSGVLVRDSRENIKSWKQRLSAQEIALIRQKTQPTWPQFYTSEDWD